jgi:shikimate kinase
MGAGKSTIGRHLAELLDKEISGLRSRDRATHRASIPLIFEIEGEAGFRGRESSVLDDLTQINVVLATGGGAILSDDNRQARAAAASWFTHAPLETCCSARAATVTALCCKPRTVARHWRKSSSRANLYIGRLRISWSKHRTVRRQA